MKGSVVTSVNDVDQPEHLVDSLPVDFSGVIEQLVNVYLRVLRRDCDERGAVADPKRHPNKQRLHRVGLGVVSVGDCRARGVETAFGAKQRLLRMKVVACKPDVERRFAVEIEQHHRQQHDHQQHAQQDESAFGVLAGFQHKSSPQRHRDHNAANRETRHTFPD